MGKQSHGISYGYAKCTGNSFNHLHISESICHLLWDGHTQKACSNYLRRKLSTHIRSYHILFNAVSFSIKHLFLCQEYH